eukprot:4788495-Lingulodinium_polyedra.AAC.1
MHPPTHPYIHPSINQASKQASKQPTNQPLRADIGNGHRPSTNGHWPRLICQGSMVSGQSSVVN